MALRPINRIKHVVDTAQTLAKGVVLPLVVALATDTPTLGATSSCETGSKINGIYFRVVIASNETVVGAIPNCYLMVVKNPGGNITFPAPNAVGASDNKRFVLHQEMRMIENVKGGNPQVFFDGVVVIPKVYRRMGPNDSIELHISCGFLDTVVCTQAHYKEFR